MEKHALILRKKGIPIYDDRNETAACYAVIDENEMTYLDGGATIADSDAYKAFLNVGQVFNQLARIFSGASSIINNINVIYKSVVELNNLLGGFIKK